MPRYPPHLRISDAHFSGKHISLKILQKLSAKFLENFQALEKYSTVLIINLRSIHIYVWRIIAVVLGVVN